MDYMNDNVRRLLAELTREIEKLYHGKLRQIILFGSYARDQQEDGSDLDIMVLVDESRDIMRLNHQKIAALMASMQLKYGVLPSVIDINYDFFNQQKAFVPFYGAVATEGKVLYGAC